MNVKTTIGTLMLAWSLPITAQAFESGSTGADGAFNPAADIQVTLPPSGIFNYTDVNIPAGVTVTYTKNANNTPVVILATGDATIDGTIDVNGGAGGAHSVSTPGVGGPGGFDGGRGGLRSSTGQPKGGDGLGPGGGRGAPNLQGVSGGGGGFASGGEKFNGNGGAGGGTYGSSNLRTLIGGSGGGGGAGSGNTGAGGGGGGGAIFIAASGTLNVNGVITARGGASGSHGGSTNISGVAGSGSGGAIRIVATTLQGEGTITAAANGAGANGGNGRIRLEAENMLRASTTSPNFNFSTPNPVFYANTPSVRITSIGGVAVPSGPSGFRDVILPGLTTNPVTVGLETTHIPLGTTISLTAHPERGTATTVTSTGVAGSVALGTASADINLPNANSTLFGQASFTITIADASQAAAYSQYAQGETVEKMRVSVNTDGQTETLLITASGKEYVLPSHAIAMN